MHGTSAHERFGGYSSWINTTVWIAVVHACNRTYPCGTVDVSVPGYVCLPAVVTHCTLEILYDNRLQPDPQLPVPAYTRLTTLNLQP